MVFNRSSTLAEGRLPVATADLYAPAALTSAYVKSVRIANTSAGSVNLTLYKKIGAGADRILINSTLLPGQFGIYSDLILSDGDILRGVASAAGVIDYVVEGVIES